MPRLTRLLPLATAVAVAGSVLHPPAGWLASPAYAQKAKGPRFAPEAFIDAAPVATGQIKRFLVNPQGEVDGLLLVDGTLVKFPPHMSDELIAVVKAGDTITVRGFREAGGAIKAFVIGNDASTTQVIEHPPVPDPRRMPKNLSFAGLGRLQVTGAVDQLLRGPQGEVNGALLGDGTSVRFPPHVGFDFAALLQTGQPLAAEGFGTENAYGKGLEATAMGPTLAALRPIYGR
jgi:hypothetical protein